MKIAPWFALLLGLAAAFRPAFAADDAIDQTRLRELHQKVKSGQQLSPEDQAYYDRGVAERQDRKGKKSAETVAAPTDSGITYPVVSEQACPAKVISITGPAGNAIPAVVRQPPGAGPFPAVILLHGGLVPVPVEALQKQSLERPGYTRFLAAGFVTITSTFRSRKENPQTRDALEDCLAVIAYVKKMPGIDPHSVVVFGGSGGGSLALELAGEADLCAAVAGEPASVLMTGMMQPGMIETSPALREIMNDPRRFYTPKLQEFTRAKISAIHCPVFIGHGDVHPINKINDVIIIPEMQAAHKELEVVLYPGQPHSFYFGSVGDPAAGQKFFDDASRFVNRYLPTRPTSIDESLVKRVAITANSKRRKAAEQ